MEKFKAWWATLSAKQKRNNLLIGGGVVFVILFSLGNSLATKPPQRKRAEIAQKEVFAENSNDADVEKVAAQTRQNRDETIKTNQKIDQLNQQVMQIRAAMSQYQELRDDPELLKNMAKQINLLQEDNEKLRDYILGTVGDGGAIFGKGDRQKTTIELAPRTDLTALSRTSGKNEEPNASNTLPDANTKTGEKPVNGPAAYDPFASPSTPASASGGKGANDLNSVLRAQQATAASSEGEEKSEEGIRIIGVGSSTEKKAEARPINPNAIQRDRVNGRPAEDPGVMIPSGSMISGVLINGLDASTSHTASANPMPVLIRIDQEAILPSRTNLDLKECFMLAGGYADLASERAHFRLERLSCIANDGGVIDVGIKGYAVGEDGKAGMRGRLVSKQGQLIAKSLLAGLAGGIGSAMSPQQVNGLQTGSRAGGPEYQTPNFGDVAQIGVMKGASSAASEISKFFLEQAKSIFPVVEIDAMRPVTFILTTPMKLQKGMTVTNSAVARK